MMRAGARMTLSGEGGVMTNWGRGVLTALRLLYALFWVGVPISGWVFDVPPPRQPTAEANAFWDAIAATGFMVPLLSFNYFVGGVLCFLERTTPLGLAMLSPPLVIAVLFNALLARVGGPWIVIAVLHVLLMWTYRAAFVPLWSYPRREPVGQPLRAG